MANFRSIQRSNYVHFRPEMMSLVKAYCAAFSIKLVEKEGRHALLPSSEGGAEAFAHSCNVVSNELFQMLSAQNLLDAAGIHYVHPESDKRDDDEIELDLSLLATWMEHGEVLVVECVGNEKHRAVYAYAVAYNHKGADVSVSIKDIYHMAAAAFGVEVGAISQATY